MSERASSYQVGGDHYSRHKIQRWMIIEEYDLNPWEAEALGYLLRRKPGVLRIEDLKKIQHNIEYLIEREERKAAAELRARQMGIAKQALAEARAHLMAAYPPSEQQRRESEEVRYWSNMARAAEMEGML
jgi:hypothetical protein